jgi:tetratricopeptide (TPR) repeat protein
MDQVGPAIEPQIRALQLYQELVQHDQENFSWAQEYYWTLILLAKDQVRLGRLDEAFANLRTAEVGLAEFASDESADVVIPRLKSALMSGLARYYLARGDDARAERLAARALEQIEPHASAADDFRVLIEFAEAAYVASETANSVDIAASSLTLIDKSQNELPEMWAMKLLLAFNAGDEERADEYRHMLAESRFAVRFVPGSRVGEWLMRAATEPQDY